MHGVTFKEVVNQLLDSGYLINKIDNDFSTVETEPYHPKYRSGLVHRMIIRVRVKASTARILQQQIFTYFFFNSYHL